MLSDTDNLLFEDKLESIHNSFKRDLNKMLDLKLSYHTMNMLTLPLLDALFAHPDRIIEDM